MNKLTTVMYHYVRPIKASRYPGIKGLEYSLFIDQIRYINKNYNVIKIEDLINYLNDSKLRPPKNPAILTFDDAYLDHFLYVYPILKKFKLEGSFFAPVQAVCNGELLDVNKIHFILSINEGRIFELLNETEVIFNEVKNKFNILDSFGFYFTKLATPGRFDTKEVIFFKRLLQVELPPDARNAILDILFKKYIGVDTISFAKELYLNTDQVKHMINDGMHFGAHGNNHFWWNKLPHEQLENEICESKNFLLHCGVNPNELTAAYPYGAYNDSAINLMLKHNFKLGFTTEVGTPPLSNIDPLKIPRLDTNDIEIHRTPKS